MPMRNPPHPGDFIRTEIIEPAGLSVTAAAAALRWPGLRCRACLTARPTFPGTWRSALKRPLE